MKKLFTILLAVPFLFSCQEDPTKLRFDVQCQSCHVSYHDENGDFVPRVQVNGEWSIQFETLNQSIEIIAQSTLCESWECPDSLFSDDFVNVYVFENGVQVHKSETCCRPFAMAGVSI